MEGVSNDRSAGQKDEWGNKEEGKRKRVGNKDSRSYGERMRASK